MVGIEAPANIDGISFLPALLQKEGQKEHDYMYWEFHEKGGRQALRKGNWKLVRYNVFDPEKTTTELYDLSKDIGEENNLAAENPEVVKDLLDLMISARVESKDFPFENRNN
jgi:arylsulfatase A-like enzyme